jgi:hypothetical protein
MTQTRQLEDAARPLDGGRSEARAANVLTVAVMDDRSEQRGVRLLVLLGALACLLDAYTTWAALHFPRSGLSERTPTTASLIAAFGLTAGLAISVAARVAIFAAVGVAAERLPKLYRSLLAIGFVGVAVTWVVVLGNVTVLAAS